MPIRSTDGTIITRRELRNPQARKKKNKRVIGKIHSNIKKRNVMTEEKAKYIYDIKLARELRERIY